MNKDKRTDDNARLSFGIVSRSRHVWSEHQARIVRVRTTGLQIETLELIEPGYVWFRERIGGTRGGFLSLSTRRGELCRATIRFVPLTWNVAHCVRERIARREVVPVRDPAQIIAGVDGRQASTGH